MVNIGGVSVNAKYIYMMYYVTASNLKKKFQLEYICTVYM